MNHRNTLNTRLLPLSILISSLVSGGAIAAATANVGNPVITKETATGEFQLVSNGTSFLIPDNTNVVQPAVEKTIYEKLEAYLTSGFITQEQKEKWTDNLKQLDEKKEAEKAAQEAADSADAKVKKLEDDIIALASQKADAEKVKDEKEKAKKSAEDAVKNTNIAKDGAITAAAKTKNWKEADLKIADKVNEFVAESAKELKTATEEFELATEKSNKAAEDKRLHKEKIQKLTSEISDLVQKEATAQGETSGLDTKLKEANKAQGEAENDSTTEIYKAKKAHEATEANLTNGTADEKKAALANQEAYDKEVKIFTDAATVAQKEFDENAKNIKQLGTDKSAAESKKSAEEQKTAGIDKAAADAANAVTPLEKAKTSAQQKENEIKAVEKAITDADNAEKLAAAADKEFDNSAVELDNITQENTAAETEKSNAETDLNTKKDELKDASGAVTDFSKQTAVDLPAVDTTIAQNAIETVAADAIAINTQVAGGRQVVAGKGKIIGSIVTGSGKITLAKNAQAIDTLITDGTMTNNGGTDTNTLVGAKGQLILTGSSDTELAKSESAVVEKGGVVTAGMNSLINNMVSEGDITAKDNAFISKTTIKGGSLTLQDKAFATDTTLENGVFTLEADTGAKGTTINGGVFDAKARATIEDTIIKGGEFNVAAGSNATNTTVDGGKFELSGAADDTELNAGEFIVAAKAIATNTTVNGGKFNLSGTAANTALNGGEFIVNAGATANNTTVNGGKFNLSGTAEDTVVNDGEFIVNAGATANNTTVKGAQFNLMNKAQASKLVVDSGKALIAGKLNDATFIDSAAAFDKTAKVSGLIDSDAKSNVAVLDGATTKDADLNLAGNMLLLVGDMQQLLAANTSRAASHRAAASNPAQFAFKNVTLKGGTIDMSHSDSQLTMASLAGQGTFNLGSALYNQASAPLHVTGDADGEFALQINNHNNGVAPTNLNVIDVDGTNAARFTLANGPVDLGNYKHSLVSDGKGGYRLVADKSALSAGVAAVMAVANTMPVIFNAELSSIQNHLDKQTTDANESGVWLTYLNDNYKVKGTAANFDQKLNGVTLGGDKAIEVGDAVVSVGAFASHSSSNIKSDYQSSGSVESNSLGAYAQYLSNGGYYFNSVLKTNQFKQNLSVTSLGHSVNGSTNLSGMGVALKAGKQFNINDMYFSPYAALSSFSSGKSQYKLSNGMAAQNQGAHTTTGTIGMNTGYRYVLNSGVELKPYTTFSLDHDFVANEKIMINNEMFNNSRKGSRANAGVGINVNLTKNLSIGSEVKFSKGKNIETPMTINMGVGYTF
ncbi:TPA: autotransporter outer membrane beta-barrel domain-containing protein [Yersinia enterocolitica]|uniref:autotransporter outer membrane beta-barrel domain-containing protein n=2 Tax=Yersinia enterocolitica TaxID=630 RepID=UPI0020C43E98|nr:autotransporter outer membrane beta-barrel domain-containing protein [Yersinia enterocolitica]HDL6854105.1 autotransporter outer membrane beta-barrel domain-containing protein [Yersinia enterocolitica]HDL6861753.1 autotransporter outer membrane beta-barrel domain-containing protein [Yersinia enterocolitica]HDL6865791.1 autotransporter outer membrane beta-barrel domain-containing protein [Yersinia enterocolitica]HDL6870216.1 autotransporter outer membrane beta-barrel domain-containing protein